MSISLVPSTQLNHSLRTDFLKQDHLIFRHLDWRNPEDFVSEPGSFAVLEGEEIMAVLACQVEAADTAWLRFFISRRDGRHTLYFTALMDAARSYLAGIGARSLYALAANDWGQNLLSAHAFSLATHIISLLRPLDKQNLPQISPTELTIRPMRASDLAAVQQIDAQAFPPEWQLHPVSLHKAYLLSGNSSLGLLDEVPIAYQISTSTLTSAHLARLAVLPAFHGRSFASALVQAILRDYAELGISEIEVNTQSENHASLSLYQHLGFSPIGAPLPVFRMPI